MKDEYTRFINKVVKTDTGCWNWVGSKYRFGYGHFRRKINNRWVMYKAHRYSYEYYKGAIGPNLFVCHTCDNPGCVNPEHLFVGTAKDNHDDKVIKGRMPLIRNPKHKLLSIDIARQIRYHKFLYPEKPLSWFASKFNTSSAQISRVLNNKIWQEVL